MFAAPCYTKIFDARVLSIARIDWVWCSWLMAAPVWWSEFQTSRVLFLALPDFLTSSGSGMGSTQPREDNCRAT
jgi:hypothetical protein